MAYEAQISRTNPAAFLFVVDQSGSMSDKMSSVEVRLSLSPMRLIEL